MNCFDFRLALLASLTGCALSGSAQSLYTLNDNGATVAVSRGGSTAGAVVDFRVGGAASMLNFEGFFIRFAGEGSERLVGDLGTPISSQMSPNEAVFSWTAGSTILSLDYKLTGFGTKGSLAERISIQNNATSSLSLSLFMYADFDLGAGPENDTAEFVGDNEVLQTDDAYQSRFVSADTPTARELAGFPDLFISLTDSEITNLNPSVTSFTGDATYAYQWNLEIAAGQTYSATHQKILAAVPEPGSIAALAFGAFAVLRRRRTKSS